MSPETIVKSILYAALGVVAGFVVGLVLGVASCSVVGLATWNYSNGQVAYNWTAWICALLGGACVGFPETRPLETRDASLDSSHEEVQIQRDAYGKRELTQGEMELLVRVKAI